MSPPAMSRVASRQSLPLPRRRSRRTGGVDAKHRGWETRDTRPGTAMPPSRLRRTLQGPPPGAQRPWGRWPTGPEGERNVTSHESRVTSREPPPGYAVLFKVLPQERSDLGGGGPLGRRGKGTSRVTSRESLCPPPGYAVLPPDSLADARSRGETVKGTLSWVLPQERSDLGGGGPLDRRGKETSRVASHESPVLTPPKAAKPSDGRVDAKHRGWETRDTRPGTAMPPSRLRRTPPKARFARRGETLKSERRLTNLPEEHG